jgi:endonuclease YncB( thermonuclease family)
VDDRDLRIRLAAFGFRRVALAVALAALAGQAGQARQDLRLLVGASFPARVVSVLDGDTIDVRRQGQANPMRVRLEGIDTPESGEPFSQVARMRTRVLAFDQDVLVEGRDVDQYGRLVARVLVGAGAERIDLSVALVGAGLACHYRYFSADPVLARAESDARTAGLGFWAPDAEKPRCVAANASIPPGTAPDAPMPPTTTRPAGAQPPPAPPGAAAFIGNVRSRVFHSPTCRNAGCPNCTRRFASRAAAEGAGFRPAGDCLR